jgi:hypothetical protein
MSGFQTLEACLSGLDTGLITAVINPDYEPQMQLRHASGFFSGTLVKQMKKKFTPSRCHTQLIGWHF